MDMILFLLIWLVIITNYLWFVFFNSYRKGIFEAIDEYTLEKINDKSRKDK